MYINLLLFLHHSQSTTSELWQSCCASPKFFHECIWYWHYWNSNQSLSFYFLTQNLHNNSMYLLFILIIHEPTTFFYHSHHIKLVAQNDIPYLFWWKWMVVTLFKLQSKSLILFSYSKSSRGPWILLCMLEKQQGNNTHA